MSAMQRDLQNGVDQRTEPSPVQMARDYIEYDYIDLDFHLTPNGWVMGDIRCMSRHLNMTKQAPADRVLTLTHRTYQISPDLPRRLLVTIAWRGEATDAQIAELRANYPAPFDPADE